MKQFTVEISNAAFQDLEQIRGNLSAQRGNAFADQFVGRIIDHLHTFHLAPFRGTQRHHWRPGLRIVGWRRTISIGFLPDETTQKVVILTVLYRGRDIESVLKQRQP